MIVCAKPFCEKIYGELVIKLISFSRCKMFKLGVKMGSLFKLRVKHGKFARIEGETWNVLTQNYPKKILFPKW